MEKINSRQLDIYIDNSKSIELGIENNKGSIESFYQNINEWSNKNDILLNYFVFNDSVSSIQNTENHRNNEMIVNLNLMKQKI